MHPSLRFSKDKAMTAAFGNQGATKRSMDESKVKSSEIVWRGVSSPPLSAPRNYLLSTVPEPLTLPLPPSGTTDAASSATTA
jgi:hypothetical protein